MPHAYHSLLQGISKMTAMEMISNTTWIACIHHYHYPKEIIFIQIWVTMDKSRDFSLLLQRERGAELFAMHLLRSKNN